jgi:hypothetical protein
MPERSVASAVFRVFKEVVRMAKDHGPTVKDDKLYEDLLRDGASKGKAARITNAKAAGTLDHRSSGLEGRTKADLLKEAKEIGMAGRSKMDKAELVKAIRKG